jgi:hypothetical protein
MIISEKQLLALIMIATAVKADCTQPDEIIEECAVLLREIEEQQSNEKKVIE